MALVNKTDNTSIDVTAIDIEPIDVAGNPQPPLLDRALVIINDLDAQPVFSEGTWNQLNNANIITTLLNPTAVSTGWDFQSSVYSTNNLSKGITSFYDPLVYAIRRMVLNPAVIESFPITGLNNANRYTFIATGSSTSVTGAKTREVTMTSDVSVDSAIFYVGPEDTELEHRGEISGQIPNAGQIVITFEGTGTSQGFVSTLEIQEST